MPSRISLPKLSLFSRHSSTHSAADSKMPPPTPPPTSTSKRASEAFPVSPPPRLHLRNILPASPEEPPIMPLPPRTPRAWVWQCHQCHNVYRLGCTRRCLDCSHTYCVVSSKQSSSSSCSSSNNRGKKRRRQQSTLCGAEFDYVGWEQWGSWKRKVLGYEATGRCDAVTRDRAFLGKRHDCWVDCDSPSECGHRRHELAAELLRSRAFAQAAIVTDVPPKSPDDDIPLTDALFKLGKVSKVEKFVMGEAVTDAEDEPPQKSPLQSSFLLDEDEEEENDDDVKKRREKEEEIWWVTRTSSEMNQTTPAYEVDEGDVKILTVRNLTENDMVDDSDSSSESGESGWSSASSL